MANIPTSYSPMPLYGEAGPLRVERAPFDHIERGAKLVVVGITPGAQQRDFARAAHAQATHEGRSAPDADRIAKFAASFGGAMRSNLVRILDHVGAARWLGVPSFAQAFDPELQGRVHFTSALRYPVFVDGANYNGQPSMLGSPLLRGMVETLLAEEARALPGAIWQPLGEKPLAALDHLVRLGVLSPDQIAPSLPHPSGANVERITFFLGGKDASSLSVRTNADKLARLRQALTAFYGSHQERA